jgi:endonuclease/exonuclease/phosphatase family metal-dependent hydrolase
MAIVRRRNERKKVRRQRAAASKHLLSPHLCMLRAPSVPASTSAMGRSLTVATYNVHRWTGHNGRSRSDPARACYVISELQADVIALQEVLRPHDGDDPLVMLSEALGLHVTFAATRVHRRGELGNAILARWPIASVAMLDLSCSRFERRVAVSVQFHGSSGSVDVVSTHLALADRTRHRQVRSLLDHPQLQTGPTVLLGDLNAWRQCKATRALDDELESHHNVEWPASFPAVRPVLALDRVYARGARIVEISAHDSRAARKASDHLPVVARVRLP